MKLDFIKTIIAIAVSGLIAYSFFAFNTSVNKDLLTFGSLFFLIITLTMTIGVSFTLPRTTSLIRTLSVRKVKS
jgi:ABC-type glycerol-3-phosphate transport system permease component